MANIAPDQKAKGTRRPLKVLTLRAVTKARRLIYDQNATDSPLLPLPPEVRNRIWQYLLGGRTIHLWDDPYDQLEHCVCREHMDEDEFARSIRALSEPVHSKSWRGRHYECHTYGRTLPKHRMSLGILKVCRQIHQEAALLPYTNNVFTLHRWHTWCLQQLVPAQAHAIRSVVLINPDRANMAEASIYENKLRGVKHLVTFKELTTPREVELFGKTLDKHGMPTGKDAVLVLESLPIERAVVAAYKVTGRDRIPLGQWGVGETAAGRWATEVERRLKAPADGLSHRQRHKRPS